MSVQRRDEGLVILGAGLAGLSAAYHAGPGARIFEAEARAGGACVTDREGPYSFDRAGHLLHLRTREVQRLIQKLLPGRFQVLARDARVHLMDTEVRYPFQANTFGLLPEVKGECVRRYLEAAVSEKKQPRNFREWTQAAFGKSISRFFFEPYNHKLWTISPSKLSLEWMKSYVPQPDCSRVIRGAFADIPEGGGYNAKFWYPQTGGIGILGQALSASISRLRLNARAVSVAPRRRTVDILGLGRIAWQRLISTLPLPVLVAILEQPPRRILEAAKQLHANSVIVVNLGVIRSRPNKTHWLYFPEAEYSFYRVGFPSNYGRMAPRGRSVLSAEVAVKAGTGWEGRKKLAGRVRRDLIKAGLLEKKDIIEKEYLQYLPYAYVIYDKNHSAARKLILDYLTSQGITSIGRWGGWEYSAMEDAILAGKQAVIRK
ncbi:FAD-dependent oxidoreductase [bacterium]|nr:FAD-dependent oxidoreductase [bacterium]